MDEEINLPDGYHISFEGEYVAQQEVSKCISVMSVVILLIIAFLLYSYFSTSVFTIQVLADIPLSLIHISEPTRPY